MYLAQGYKREAIAEKTGLTLSTVKSHIKLAYEKLEAGNVANAVARARALGIAAVERALWLPAIPGTGAISPQIWQLRK